MNDADKYLKSIGLVSTGELERKKDIVFEDGIEPKLRGPHGGEIDCILLENISPHKPYIVDNK